ncbi:hypothetical protein TraAM80_03379 [Trypanosoma rangeli]|uniref:BAR domain-containing protein n=1 Tax=Trypanosoma rangeli TaxID=5698 RepID=A0A3R7KGK2_TRYRA|nr:uncharacterized protein TraAM80_03379 [Trypanosoma rangeli]RNF07258.1 hypothetical protein TraAM80_03379 [Trypanosoma rangeli]|eukprot:RNF07258.1 hypothetical protein TraAM80_03379 [Trypanosoma rangeli]
MGLHSANADPQAVLVERIEEGMKAFNEASKNYIVAVRKVDSALEDMVVSFRQMSFGDIPPSLRSLLDSFSKEVGNHRNTAATESKGENSFSDRTGGNKYVMAQYVNDFMKRTDCIGDGLKSLMKLARVKHEEHEKVGKKYNEARTKAEKIAASDVKKNRNSSENPDYVKYINKRDALRLELTKREDELARVCHELQERRVDVIKQALNAMGDLSSQYWSGVAQVMRSAGTT